MKSSGSPKKSTRGQISLMVGIMMMTFFLLFAFVINTGMLVNAKINLQNAADMAAYAGASVQARQLTHISYLNYEMRRQYKKLIFRLNVIGSMAQQSFPKTSVDAPMIYRPNLQGGEQFPTPTTCIIFQQNNNICQVIELGAVPIPSGFGLDSITETLAGELRRVEEIRQKNCAGSGQTNKILNLFWLFNSSLNTSQLALPPDQASSANVIQALIAGIGLVPREVLLKMRIDTLKDYVNAPPQLGLTVEKANILQLDQDPPSVERSIQAFFSAFYTLGNHTFPATSIVMDELIPPVLLQLKNVNAKIDTFAVDLAVGGDLSKEASQTGAACKPVRVPVSVASEIPVGVFKDPSFLTYYAIRLKAKARILFSPFGDIELKAYSAAQPFGSRIGPPLTGTDFTYAAEGVGGNSASFPNLPLKDSDSASRGAGWDKQDVVFTMFNNLSSGGNLNSVGSSELDRAYVFAMAPNPFERSRYNIMTDGLEDGFVRNFDTSSLAAIWAPVFSPKKKGNLGDVISSTVKNLFGEILGGLASTRGGGSLGIQATQDALIRGLTNYATQSLLTDSGEDGESINVARLRNPSEFRGIRAVGDEKFFVNDPKKLRTSWNSVGDGDLRTLGRTGYSVKFVSFQTLTKKKIPSNGVTTWVNDIPADGEAEGDLPFIKH